MIIRAFEPTEREFSAVLDVLEPDDFDLVDLRSLDHAIEYDTGNPSDGLSGPGFELADDLIATA